MLTVGYGDITPYNRHASVLALLIAIGVMLLGVSLGGVFIATITAALNRAQQAALSGLRRIHAENHVILCGAGNVGTRVIDFLLQMDQQVVVIERYPSALLLEHARTRKIDLLAGDATSDDVLDFCDLHSAQSLVAVTDSDTANLEAALGALVQNPDLPVVMRMHGSAFFKVRGAQFQNRKIVFRKRLDRAGNCRLGALSRHPWARHLRRRNVQHRRTQRCDAHAPRRRHGSALCLAGRELDRHSRFL